MVNKKKAFLAIIEVDAAIIPRVVIKAQREPI